MREHRQTVSSVTQGHDRQYHNTVPLADTTTPTVVPHSHSKMGKNLVLKYVTGKSVYISPYEITSVPQNEI